MPTGYTARLCDGPQSFESFVLTCSRAFGALIEMRDESLDAPIPEKFEPSPYYKEAKVKAEREYKRLLKMTDAQAIAYGKTQQAKEIKECEESIAKATEVRNRLNEMKAKVVQWNPPTKDHVELKKFMLQQLNETVRFDGSSDYSEKRLAEIRAKSPKDFYEEAVEHEKRSSAYYTEEMRKEAERMAERTEWVQQLRESLETSVAPK